MPTLIVGVVVVDVPPPCCESLISFPHVEHLLTVICKIGILLQLDVEFCGGLLLERSPRGHNGKKNQEV
jgi:hypothetical protein